MRSDGDPPPFPIAKSQDRQALPARPFIVRAYLATEVLSIVIGVMFDVVERERFSLSNLAWSLAFTSVAVLVIWNASRIGWSIVTAMAILFLPFMFSFLDRGALGKASVAAQLVSLGILVSPWMLRWIWRDGRPMVVEEVDEAGASTGDGMT